METLKNKFKTLITNKLVLICLCYALIYFLSGFNKWIQIINCILALVCFIVLTPQEAFCLFLFSHCFTLSNIIYSFTFCAVLVEFVLIMYVRYINGVNQRKYKVHKPLATIFTIIVIASSIISPFFGICSHAIFYIIYLPLFYLFITMRKEFNIRQAFSYLLYGLILSVVLAGFSLLFNKHYEMSVILQNRFRAYASNPNYLYTPAIFLAIYYMYLYLKIDLGHIKFYTIYTVCALIILSTSSKTGLFFLALFTLIFMILYLSADFKKRFKYALILLAIVLIVGIVLWQQILTTINRLFNTNDNLLTSILTNRDQIWLVYLQQWCENPFTFFFGRGIFSAEPFVPIEGARVASHNLYVFSLYRFGVIGTAAFAYCIYLVIKHHKDYKFSFIAFMPMLWYILQGMCDNVFRPFNIMYIVLCFMVMFESKKEIKSNSQIKKERFQRLKQQKLNNNVSNKTNNH